MNESIDVTALKACARLIHLERPLAFFDLETTGVDIENDAVIQVGIARIDPDMEVQVYETLVDPGRPVPEEVQELTGITPEMLFLEPRFPDVADAINEILGESDLCGYNVVRFDLPFLENEFERHGLTLEGPADRQVLDPYQIFRKKEPHTLEQAVAHYTGQRIEQTHRALDDVLATTEVMAAQLVRYGFNGALPEVVADARHPHLDAEGKLEKDGERVLLCFGKHKGSSIADVESKDPSYLDWVIREIGGEVGQLVKQQRRVSAAYMDESSSEDWLPF